MGYLIRTSALQGFDELVKKLGGDPYALLNDFKIPRLLLHEEDAFIPFRSLNGLYEASANQLDCPDFGMQLASIQGIRILGPIAIIARHSASIEEGIRNISRYLHVHSPAFHTHFDLLPDQGLMFNLEILEPSLPHIRQVTESSLTIGLHILRILNSPESRPKMVLFAHKPLLDVKHYQQFFGCPVLFEQPKTGMVLRPEILQMENKSADAATHQMALHYLESQFTYELPRLSEQVTHLIRRLLPTGHCRIDTIADQLCFQTRTLQRRLSQEQLHFQTMVDRERKELAARYLADSALPLTQVAGLLGYAEQSAFIRACRRWFGQTPNQYRRQAQST
ncbi:AraC family transcriptional regulator [Oleiphilus messinensis]|uniref:AraC family transcriptional regulator n=1 Tax=Oleiphilus messinensis TaxID=141451 RepID=A0A1Y0I1I9_9GAMM|nr:AraC family transcriptional regulator [Oleiphilus messinensis]ARU54312.1 AraC family transcriptional regulator [Oleiphilus messinensis]